MLTSELLKSPVEVDRAESDRRLCRLVEILRELPDARFDYTQWIGTDWQGNPDLSCGTTACALGWAAADPEFQRLGLSPAWRSQQPVIEYQDGLVISYGFTAAAHFFGVTAMESSFLFGPNNEDFPPYYWTSPRGAATPGMVADHIDHFIRVRRSNEG